MGRAGNLCQIAAKVDSKKLEYGCRVTYAGFLTSAVFGLEDGHAPTFWLLLCSVWGPGFGIQGSRQLTGRLRLRALRTAQAYGSSATGAYRNAVA